MCLFCHFDILVFEFHAIWTIRNTKYKKYLVYCLLMVREHSFIFYSLQILLMERAHNIFTFISIFFSNERANPKTKESIPCDLTDNFCLCNSTDKTKIQTQVVCQRELKANQGERLLIVRRRRGAVLSLNEGSGLKTFDLVGCGSMLCFWSGPPGFNCWISLVSVLVLVLNTPLVSSQW